MVTYTELFAFVTMLTTVIGVVTGIVINVINLTQKK